MCQNINIGNFVLEKLRYPKDGADYFGENEVGNELHVSFTTVDEKLIRK